VFFVQVSDGSVDHKLQVSERVRAVEVADSAVYTMGYDPESDARRITRGTVDDLTDDWEHTYELDDSANHCPGSGDALYDGVEGNIVYSGNDAGVIIADSSDGQPLLPTQVNTLYATPGQGFTAHDCSSTNFDTVDTMIFNGDGEVLRTVTDEDSAANPLLVRADSGTPYIIGRSAYDFASGNELWNAGAGPRLHTIIGDTVLAGGASGGPLTGYDIASGEKLWTANSKFSDVDLSDGRRVMSITENGLVAIDLATGEQVWSLAEVGMPGSVAIAGTGFAHITNDFLSFYSPTGGPSAAPGRAGDAGSGGGDESGGLITKCGRTPEMRPIRYRADNGDLVVKMEVKARCPGGDIVSTDRLRVTIRDDRGLICTGLFDFSRDPLELGGEGSQPASIEFRFASGTYSRHPNTLGDRSGTPSGGGSGAVTEADASGAEVVDCEDEGAGGGQASAATFGTSPNSVRSAEVGGVPNCGSETDTLAALRAQVDADRPFVQADLVDRWVAQLSSKQPGLVAPDVDGRVVTWTPCEILQQHLRMRGQYPEVRLVWSDEWRTFDLAGWWVTIAGVTFPNPDAANGWCDARSIPVDECFAKVVSNAHDSRDSTKYRR
jgi:hypothetical protein